METETFRPVQTLFYWPLAFAFLLSLIFAMSHIWQGRATPLAKNTVEAK
jgi:Ca-activated chloride channel family protein